MTDSHPRAEPSADPPSTSHETEELGFDLPPPARPRRTHIVLALAAMVVVVGGAILFGWRERQRATHELATETRQVEDGPLRVRVITAKAKPSERAMILPGSVQPLEETTIYPRANGYVRTWKFDIGDPVKEGALLAEIDTPEIEQQLAQGQAQLAQAQAGLVQARANRTYAGTTLDRVKELTPKGVASQQELDKAEAQSVVDEANVEVASANVEAQKANLRRLVQLQGFSRVTAPFSGRITARMVERGALVSAATPLFKLSQSETVRVFIQVPQNVATGITVGAKTEVSVREWAGRVFEGQIARSAGALDPQSRTMNVEIRVPNEKLELLAGMYAQVALKLASPHPVWELPATAVMTDARGVRVAIVKDAKVHLVPVTVERDNGATIEIASGIDEGDTIVKLGNAELVEGRAVEIAK